MDMSQYRDLFLSETREHLNNINRLVGSLEQAPIERETIDALFREAHSIKGMAASMGFVRTAELAHHLEDFLDSFRAIGVISAESVERVLSAIDLLEGLFDDLMADRPERAIDDFLTQPRPAEKSPSFTAEEVEADNEGGLPMLAVEEEASTEHERDDSAVTEVRADDANGPVIAEPEALQVVVDLAEETAMPSGRCLLILRDLARFGEVLSSQPTEADLRQDGSCHRIQVWLRTFLSKGQIEESLRSIADVMRVDFVDDRRKETRVEKVPTVRVRTDLLDQLVNLTGELITHRYMLQTAATVQSWAEMASALSRIGRLIDDLHHGVLQARLMPLENLTARLPRVVRELSRKAGKRVTLRVLGAEVGIDRVVLDQLNDPLMHLVRNAVDHGIAETGTVTISARKEKDLVLVEVGDDGRGMDPVALRQKAVERGLLTKSQADHLADRDAFMLVCQPGFSTAVKVTETSGRGVGMDVVKAAVEKLGGSLDIHSKPEEGTRFQMRLPLSVAIIKVLLVECDARTLAIPITRVQRTLDLKSTAVQRSGQQKVFEYGEDTLPLVSLASLLNLADPPPAATTWVVLTEVHGRRIGLQIDRFLGQREAFVKSLDFPLKGISGLGGATVAGDGRVIFIIDPHTLLEDHALALGPAEGGQHAISTPD